MAAGEKNLMRLSPFLPITRTDWFRVVLLGTLFYVTGKLSFSLAVAGDYVAMTVFIPVGIALAFTILYGYRVWPGIFIGQLLLLITAGQTWGDGLMVALGNTISSLLGAWLFARFGLNIHFKRSRDVSGLLLITALVLQPLSATLGTLPLLLAGRLDMPAWVQLWGSWWLGNMMAHLLFTPLLLTWVSSFRAHRENATTLLKSALLVALLTIILSLYVFGHEGLHHFLTLAYCFPFMILVGIVWGARGASLAAVLLAGFAIQATLSGHGSFSRQAIPDRIIDINVFILGIALVGLYIATLFAERKASEARMATSEQRLTATLESAPHVAVQWYDQEARVLYWNRASERLFGWSAAESIGKTLDQLIYTEAETGRFLTELKSIGASAAVVGPLEASVRHRDGSDRSITSTIFSIPGDASPIFVRMDVDITERKQAELALQASEQRFRQLFENVHEAVAVHALDGRPLIANRRLLEMFGVSAEEFDHYSIAEDYSAPGMPVDRLPAIWADVMAGNERNFEWRGRRPHDGHEFDLDVTLARFRYGDLDAILVTERDITESKSTASALRESEARFRTLFEYAPVAYQSLDINGNYLDVNQPMTAMLGYSREELLGTNFGDLWEYPGQFQRVFEEFVCQCVTTGELQLRRKDGEIVTVLQEGRIQRDATGNFVRTHCVLYDISARKRAEDALNRYRFIVNSVQDMMTVVGTDHRYEVVNDAWCRAVHRPRELVLGHHLAEVWGEEVYREHIAPMLEQCFSSDRAIELHTTVHLPELGERECTISYLPYREMPGADVHAVIITRDVTEEVQAERAMIMAMESAESANRAKSVFLAQMSHELRTPLNAIIGFAQMLDLGVPVPLDPPHREAVGHILGSGRHLLRLINEVLDLACIEAGKMDLAAATMDIGSSIQEAVVMTQALAADRGIIIRPACLGGMEVHADAVRVRQILLNLLSNAVKYNHEGGLVAVYCQPKGDVVRVSVVDTGPGIPPERLAQLFQPFQRLGAEQTSIEGTGIGLVVCKTLAEAMGGQIGFQSELGIGSRFWLDMPAARVSADSAAVETTSATVVSVRDDGLSGRVLYIEDNPVNRSVMQHVFRHLRGVTLLTAETAEAGLAMIRDNPPNLVLMDISLPGMSGLDALQAIKRDPRSNAIPVIAVSAAALPSDVKNGIEAGFIAYFTKPFDVPKLLALVRSVLEHRPTGVTAGGYSRISGRGSEDIDVAIPSVFQ